ncbi:toxin-antitoxin system, toxin component, MazF family protein [Companilactobacillus farciminis]|uniref:toxin-antitoxin system, toxin component, MazF family protein n=1 Tax=Companilactobacillus farciminis TaxID=1612 RepID=UPI00232CA4B3|nr:toxin-antitoxin system, toxin component, MazF family protein [Companilactobacillus farciminis]WCG35989.1 toxin-antitoxin system, toxin component, MazF family protein [Companilactobacillus farciminis]
MMNPKTIKSNDILIFFVAFVDTKGGKKRPILVTKVNQNDIVFFSMTSKYSNKSKTIQKQYYPIINWKESGLNKPTFIDIGNIRKTQIDDTIKLEKIGSLTIQDKIQLAAFIAEYKKGSLNNHR